VGVEAAKFPAVEPLHEQPESTGLDIIERKRPRLMAQLRIFEHGAEIRTVDVSDLLMNMKDRHLVRPDLESHQLVAMPVFLVSIRCAFSVLACWLAYRSLGSLARRFGLLQVAQIISSSDSSDAKAEKSDFMLPSADGKERDGILVFRLKTASVSR